MSRVEHLAEGVTLYLGDCRGVFGDPGRLVPCVDCVVTSPPYDELRNYGPGFESSNWFAVIESCAALLNKGGVIVWNVADQTVDGSETGTSFRQALHAMKCGLRLHDTMIYCKEGVTFPDANRYHPAFEYMFVFSKGAPQHFNGIRDWKNKWAGASMSGTARQVDGSSKQKNNNGSAVSTYGLRRNWWVVSNAARAETAGHPAPMPFGMASDHIQTWTSDNAVVLDPFMGSGTTGVAAVKLGRGFVGIELHEPYFDIACRRIADALARPDLFIAAPAPKAKQEVML